MELEFHAGFFKQLDFRQIEFFIETRFSKNQVSKQGHIPKWFQTRGILLESFGEMGILSFWPNKSTSLTS